VRNALFELRIKGNQVRDFFDERGPVINLSGLLQSHTSLSGYERGGGAPVYMVTTPWGSPYMLSDKGRDYIRSIDLGEQIAQNFLGDEGGGIAEEEEGGKKKKSKIEKAARPSRSIAPMFTDARDAESLLMEMNQMGGLDVRITATSMSRALRQCSVLGRGMPTGAIASNGNLEGYLRYKLVPSSRELYYASGCKGRESVGFPTEEEEEVSKSNSVGRRVTQVRSTSAAQGMEQDDKICGPIPRWATPFEMLGRKSLSDLRPMSKKAKAELEQREKKDAYDFMKDGRKGVPVFYVDGLELPQRGLASRLKGDKRGEVPMFFSYEDCVRSWKDMRTNTLKQDGKNASKDQQLSTRASIDDVSEDPPIVEVFNYIDVLASIDREQHKRKVATHRQRSWEKLLRGSSTELPPRSKVENVVFIPSSSSVNYKETITRSGNCKARIRPMR
jgi:hypothetical protein